MGQKVNPHGFRVGPTLIRNWDSIFYAENNYKDFIISDIKIRELIFKTYKTAQVGRVVIERPSNKVITINIYAKKVGIIIGKSGNDIEKLKKNIQKISLCEIYINIHEIKKPDIDAKVVAQNIATQIEKWVSYRKAMKQAIQRCLKAGASGIKVQCSGRLSGAEIARTEWYREGRVPLHTLRADLDYAQSEALTTYGIIGIKVWIYKGEYIEGKKHR